MCSLLCGRMCFFVAKSRKLYLYTQQCKNLSHLVTQRFAVYKLRNLEWRLCLQKLNTKYLKRSFCFSRVLLCNKVPQGLKKKNAGSIGQFKRDIKKVCYISDPRRPVMWSKCKGSLSFYLLSSTGDSACETFYLAFHVPSLYRACLHTHYRKHKLDVLIVHLNIYKETKSEPCNKTSVTSGLNGAFFSVHLVV